ncbi:MAG: glycosyltransferase family 4 protein [Candidatus Bathyarchaeia archaeon]
MRILLVNTGCFPIPPQKGGGQESHVYNLAVSLAKLGHEVHLISDVTEEAHIHNKIIVRQINAPPASFKTGIYGLILNETIGGLFAFKSSFSQLTRKCDVDVIHIHGRLAALLISLMRMKLPLIYTLHDSSPWMCSYDSVMEEKIRKIAYTNIEVRICRRADRIIAVSKTIKNELISRWNISDKKVAVIPSGVNIDSFKPENKSNYCLFVGQLTRRKGVECLIHSMHRLSMDLQCIIVGEGPERTSLTELVNKLNISNKIVFTSAVPFNRLKHLYAHASFFVLPSISEGLPLTILEAMASGCPVIASRISGVIDVVKDGYNGFLVEPRDVETLSNRIEILAGDHKLREIMGRRAREAVEKWHSWDSIAERVTAIYKEAMETFH